MYIVVVSTVASRMESITTRDPFCMREFPVHNIMYINLSPYAFLRAGMEILGNLCQVEENEETLGESLEEKNYIDIVNKLTVQDIQLIVATLEVLYQLSELGEVTTTHIASVKTCVGK